MAVPPELLQQFAVEPGMNPEALAVDKAAETVYRVPDETDPGEDATINGWGYRTYSDGRIKIIMAPEGHRAGAILTGGPAYDAIRREIAATKAPPPAAPPTPFPAPSATGATGINQALASWRAAPPGGQ